MTVHATRDISRNMLRAAAVGDTGQQRHVADVEGEWIMQLSGALGVKLPTGDSDRLPTASRTATNEVWRATTKIFQGDEPFP